MEIFGSLLAITLLLLLLFFILKPQGTPKSKEDKQAEIRRNYQQKLQAELDIVEADERQKKKIILLKAFAKELEFNLFFDKEEVRELIQTLAKY